VEPGDTANLTTLFNSVQEKEIDKEGCRPLQGTEVPRLKVSLLFLLSLEKGLSSL